MRRVGVIGDGLAGSVAALEAARCGAEVTLFAGAPGGSALWSGVCEVYGPAYDTVDYQGSLGAPHLRAPARAPLEAPADRFARLVRRRNFHPYARLGLGPAEVAEHLTRAQGLLGETLNPQRAFSGPAPPFYVANGNGTARLADGAAASLRAGVLHAAARFIVVGLAHYPAFSAEAVAAQLGAHGLPAEARWIALPGAPLTQDPAAAAAAIEAAEESARTELLASLREASSGATVLLPPVFGRSLDAHERLWRAVSEACSGRAAECAGLARSLHGVRLQGALRRACERAGVTRVGTRVEGAEEAGRTLRALRTVDGESHAVDAVVLATGRTLGGGIRREPPLTEALFGLPVYLEGVPLEADHRYPPELATRRVLDDHLLFTMGIGVSSRLEPLDQATSPRFDNLFAAGLILGGTNFTRDGSAFGTGLVTGLLAGRWAAGEG